MSAKAFVLGAGLLAAASGCEFEKGIEDQPSGEGTALAELGTDTPAVRDAPEPVCDPASNPDCVADGPGEPDSDGGAGTDEPGTGELPVTSDGADSDAGTGVPGDGGAVDDGAVDDGAVDDGAVDDGAVHDNPDGGMVLSGDGGLLDGDAGAGGSGG